VRYTARHAHDSRSEGKGLSLSAAPADGDRPLLSEHFLTQLFPHISDSGLYSCTTAADPEPKQTNPWALRVVAQRTVMEKLLNEYFS